MRNHINRLPFGAGFRGDTMHHTLPKWRLTSHFVSIILIALLVGGCSSAPPARVVDRDQPPTRKILTHRVAPDETLYSIAWRYNLDYRELARHNGIDTNYTIYKGQVLRLDINNPASRVRPARSSVAAATPTRAPASRPAVTSRPATQAPPVATATPAARPQSRSENRTTAPPPTIADPVATGPVKWQWPASGPLIGRYNDNTGLNKGIDIGGKLGQPVVAAGAGNVVYAGTGLRGYGNLVIIKHSETFLSAYAHNNRLLVKEGQGVKAGQQIAELGSSGTDREKLHFEIRRDGKPVNPLQYLPKR